MSDIDQMQLQAQTDLLREIREELRATRGMAASSGSGGMSMGAARPGHTFVAAQAAADRTLLGQWSSFGWSAAYQPGYQSTLFGDLSAMIGFNRAPQTLTQEEFRGLAGQNIAARASNFAMGMIAPGYVAHTNALADDIFRNSSRFIRSGNPNAGVLGTGFDYGVARSLSRQIQHEALGDLRMSGTDYSTITSLGMQSGQFDKVGDAAEFKSRVKELASATADMTRAIHMTVSEVGTAMGNLRQMGVMSVAQQKQIMMQVGGSAMVAGMSAPEMMQFAGSIGQQGQALGLTAGTTMPAAAQTLAAIRSLSQAGIISQGTLALGGGAAGIAGQIMGAEMRFATSNGGYLSQLGGGGRAGANGLSSMIGGLGAVGTFEGAMTFGLDKFQVQQHMSPAESGRLLENSFNANLRMMGVSDVTSHMAQGMVFNMAKQAGMDDAAASAYVSMHNTASGRRTADAATMQAMAATRQREQAVLLDRAEIFTSAKGRIAGALANIEGLGASAADSAMSAIEEFMGGGAAGRRERSLRQIMAGTRGVGLMSPDDFNDILTNSRGPESQVTTTHIRNHDAHTFGAVVGGSAIALIGGALSLTTGGIAAPLVVGAASFAASSAITTRYAMDTQTTLTGTQATWANSYQNLANNANAGSAKNDQIRKKGGLQESESFKGLLRLVSSGSANADDVMEMRTLIQGVAFENKITPQEVTDYFAAMGLKLTPGDMASITSSGGPGASAEEKAAMGFALTGTHIAATTAAQNTALANYTEKFSSGAAITQEDRLALGKAGISNKDIEAFRSRIGAVGGARERGLVATGFRKDAEMLSAKNSSNFWRGLTDLVSARAGELQGDDKELYANEKKESRQTIDLLLGPGVTHDLASEGKLGAISQQIASLDNSDMYVQGESGEDWTRREVEKYHFDTTNAEALYAASGNSKVDRRKAIAAALINSTGGQEEMQTGAKSEAQLLQSAAEILAKLQQDLK